MAKDQTWSNVGEFVSEGVMVAVRLCFPGQSVPPPAGETAMTALALDERGTVYCGTRGTRAHVLAATIRTDTGIVHDLGVVPEATSIDGLSVWNDRVYVVASGPKGSGIWSWPLFRGSFYIQEWGLRRHSPERVCELFADASVAHAVAVEDGRVFVGIAQPSGQVFRVDLASPKLGVLGKVDERGAFSRRLGADRCGRVWGSCGSGQLWTHDPMATEPLRKLEMRIPAAAGRAQHTQASAWAVDPVTRVIYGGTTPDGFLFKIEPGGERIIPLGKPARFSEITCLTVGNDGRLFGMAGAEDDIGHLFCYEPPPGALRDLGIPVSALGAREYGYHYGCAITGPQGEMYFGQQERVNQLWVYFPPVPVRTAREG
jgi:hypothetical protein